MGRISSLLFVLVAARSPGWAASGPCYPTPQAAMQRTGAIVGANTGFRVESATVDPFLGRTWVAISSCEHPDWPLLTVASPLDSTHARTGSAVGGGQPLGLPIVRIGRTVRVVLMEAQLRLEMPAVAEENGRMGDRIRVRLLRLSSDSTEQYRTAIVRSPDSLELLP